MKDQEIIQEKLSVLNNQTKAYVEDMKQLVMKYKRKSKHSSLIGYFTYSLSTTNNRREENIILGDFHILNLTEDTINNVYLCLQINTKDTYDFSGKYRTNKMKLDNTSSSSLWELFEENINDEDQEQDQKDHWFRLAEEQQLSPLETISFSGFQIKWKNQGSFSCSVQAFIYSNAEEKGITSLNSINVSTKA
ncbi:hypothetical protein SAMN05216389_12633 [Oceanobacillus limi]|uniref:Uncharacterized protein n=1 Tax=Oceanobacillus limi TaxID=930131 RepID=A0A1I0H2A1_9BACI|nr:hypothetical protein [Oceanobacillus limi]SET76921.1 hypothetical protein SAMN05216389_12633 [Oceanobacillus limi]